MSPARRTAAGLGLALAVTLALAPLLPRWASFLVTVSIAKGLVALGLLLLMRTGLVSFGQGLYFALGAYAAAGVGRALGVHDAVPMVLAGIVAAAAAAGVVGLLLARYRTIFFAMLSLALAMILNGLLVRTPAHEEEVNACRRHSYLDDQRDRFESTPLPPHLKLAEVFELKAVVLYDRRTGEFHRAGPADFEGRDDQLRDSALQGTSFTDAAGDRVITAVRLGSEPIASLALQGARMSDGVLQGVANLVAIGLERARAQDLAHQVEAARQSEQLRTTLIDAMAHEFKTPLTSIKAATTSLRSNPEQPAATRAELIEIADEETEHLQTLIDDAIEMARLDTSHIEIQPVLYDLCAVVREEVTSMRAAADGRPIDLTGDALPVPIAFDLRLVTLAVRQLLDNALKYSPPGTPVTVRVEQNENGATVAIANGGPGIAVPEQARIFQRFYRSPSVKHQVPGTGLGLSIAHSIAQAHHGDLTVSSRPGETAFRLTLPRMLKESR